MRLLGSGGAGVEGVRARLVWKERNIYEADLRSSLRGAGNDQSRAYLDLLSSYYMYSLTLLDKL